MFISIICFSATKKLQSFDHKTKHILLFGYIKNSNCTKSIEHELHVILYYTIEPYMSVLSNVKACYEKYKTKGSKILFHLLFPTVKY